MPKERLSPHLQPSSGQKASHRAAKAAPRPRASLASLTFWPAGGSLLVLLCLSLGACSSLPPIELYPQPRPATEVLVFVPGITGVQLRDRETSKVLWGTGPRLLFPRDGGYGVALPIRSASEGSAETTDGVEAFAPIEKIRLLKVFGKEVYGPVFELLTSNGFRRGKLEAPTSDDNLFSYSYDWRRDNVVAVKNLVDHLAKLQILRGQPLKVNLVCQSNGAHLCRYLAKYGASSLEQAEAGGTPLPPGIEISKLILIGTSNGGSLRILREMNRGRNYLGPFGRHWSQEAVFTFQSLYQDLPAYRTDLFVDEQGKSLPVDLYEAENWLTYGWSIYGEKTRKRLQDRPRPDLFGNADQRRAFLEENLATARRFQQLLHQDAPGFGHPRYYLIQNVYEETADRALLVREKGQWRTYFTGDKRLNKAPYLRALTSAPGDGHAAKTSQLFLSPQETNALGAAPFYVQGGHFELILDPGAKRRLLEFIND
ncbi:MAG: hypothetical protein K0U98_01255 [Deltaproteobacteria bacterium]|nr:hypothetical protein [Deltaproteobacteria bacterium]